MLEITKGCEREKLLEKYKEYKKQYNDGKLWEVYGSISRAKFLAVQHCQDVMAEYNGEKPQIVSSNGFRFTYGFTFKKDGKEYFAFITKDKELYTALDD